MATSSPNIPPTIAPPPTTTTTTTTTTGSPSKFRCIIQRSGTGLDIYNSGYIYNNSSDAKDAAITYIENYNYNGLYIIYIDNETSTYTEYTNFEYKSNNGNDSTPTPTTTPTPTPSDIPTDIPTATPTLDVPTYKYMYNIQLIGGYWGDSSQGFIYNSEIEAYNAAVDYIKRNNVYGKFLITVVNETYIGQKEYYFNNYENDLTATPTPTLTATPTPSIVPSPTPTIEAQAYCYMITDTHSTDYYTYHISDVIYTYTDIIQKRAFYDAASYITYNDSFPGAFYRIIYSYGLSGPIIGTEDYLKTTYSYTIENYTSNEYIDGTIVYNDAKSYILNNKEEGIYNIKITIHPSNQETNYEFIKTSYYFIIADNLTDYNILYIDDKYYANIDEAITNAQTYLLTSDYKSCYIIIRGRINPNTDLKIIKYGSVSEDNNTEIEEKPIITVLNDKYYIIKTKGASNVSNITKQFMPNYDLENNDRESYTFNWWVNENIIINPYYSNKTNSITNFITYPVNSDSDNLICYYKFTELIPGQYKLTFNRLSGDCGTKYNGYIYKFGERVETSWYDTVSSYTINNYCYYNITKNEEIIFEENKHISSLRNISNNIISISKLSDYDVWDKTFISRLNKQEEETSDNNKKYKGTLTYKLNAAYINSVGVFNEHYTDNYKTGVSFIVESVNDVIQLNCYYNNTISPYYGNVYINLTNFNLEYIE